MTQQKDSQGDNKKDKTPIRNTFIRKEGEVWVEEDSDGNEIRRWSA